MGKYLKLFENHTQYEEYITGETAVLPNVSHCINEAEVHYNQLIVAQPLVVKYNVTDASNPTQLYAYNSQQGITINGAAMFDKVEIDGTEVSISDLDTASGKTQFSAGEHTIRYTLKDPAIIGLFGGPSDPTSMKIGAMFAQCADIVSVEIPSSVTSIGNEAFSQCSSLTSVTIPSGVTSIEYGAFSWCTSLESVTVEAITPPTLKTYVFNNNAEGRKIYVPSESVDAYKAASGWSDYASIIEAIP